MLIEICVAIIAITMVSLVIILTRVSFQLMQSIRLLQVDLHDVSKEVTRVLNTVNDFVRADLHAVSKETNHLMSNLKNLSSDIHGKIDSLNFLFRPLKFLSSKMGADSEDESSSQGETIQQILKWVVSTVFLIKTTKELVKNEK